MFVYQPDARLFSYISNSLEFTEIAEHLVYKIIARIEISLNLTERCVALLSRKYFKHWHIL